MKKTLILVSLFSLMPLVASAQLTGVARLIANVAVLVDALTVIVVAIGLLVFFWGLITFIFKLGGDAKAATDGKTYMIWGVVAMFVMISIWGLVRFIQGEVLPGANYGPVKVPTFTR